MLPCEALDFLLGNLTLKCIYYTSTKEILGVLSRANVIYISSRVKRSPLLWNPVNPVGVDGEGLGAGYI